METRALRESDDRSRFRSGDADLDRFFHKYAGRNQFRHHVGTTYVAAEADQLPGYVTVAPGTVDADAIPASARTKLPRYPLPILRLARLAVDERAQGRGIGRALLRFVLALAARLADEVGCVGVVVDAKPGAVDFYARVGFVPLDAVEGGSAARPGPVAMFLPVHWARTAKNG
jgi:GNAT superfamily N-acetyltransferase